MENDDWLLEQMLKLTKYEEALKEVIEQKGLVNFLNENDWATTEDYFAHIAREALRE